jgi:hypothetical protein
VALLPSLLLWALSHTVSHHCQQQVCWEALLLLLLLTERGWAGQAGGWGWQQAGLRGTAGKQQGQQHANRADLTPAKHILPLPYGGTANTLAASTTCKRQWF